MCTLTLPDAAANRDARMTALSGKPGSKPDATSDAMPMASVFQRLAGPLDLVKLAMRQRLGSPSELVVSIGDHVLSSGGKRMRPALVLMSA